MRRGIATILSATAVTSAVMAVAGFAAPAQAGTAAAPKPHEAQSVPVIATDSYAGYEASTRNFRFIHGNSGTAITPLQIVATDTDTSQILTYSATGLPAGLSIDPSTGVISGTPTTGSATPSSVTVTVADTSGASGSATFNWTIHNVVTVTSPGNKSSVVSVAITPVTITATDSNPSITTFTWSAGGTLPPGLSINSSTGVITGTPGTTTGSPFTVTITATDSTGRSGTTIFTWTVTGT